MEKEVARQDCKSVCFVVSVRNVPCTAQKTAITLGYTKICSGLGYETICYIHVSALTLTIFPSISLIDSTLSKTFDA